MPYFFAFSMAIDIALVADDLPHPVVAVHDAVVGVSRRISNSVTGF